MEDPFDWSIDRVVQEFCNNLRPLWSRSATPPLPDAATFEKSLRDNDVDGEILLSIDDQTLRDELGVRSLGQRRTIEKAIRYLRGQSTMYQEQNHENQLPPPLPTAYVGGFRMPRTPASAYPQCQQPTLQSYLHMQSPATTSPGLNSLPDHSSVTNAPRSGSVPAAPLTVTNLAALRSASEFPDHRYGYPLRHDFQLLRERFEGPSGFFRQADHDAASREDDGGFGKGRSVDLAIGISNTLEPNEDAGLKDNVAVRHESQGFGGHAAKPTHTTDMSARPSSNYTLVGGKKRIVPTFVSHLPKDRHSSAFEVLPLPRINEDRSSSRGMTAEDLYLQQERLGAEDVFYGDPQHDTEPVFRLARSNHAKGQRLFVARLMKGFLRQPRRNLPHSRAVVRIPYRQSLIPDGQQQFFTMFAPGLEPAMHNVSHWPSLLPTRRHLRGRGPFLYHLPVSAKVVPDANPFQSSAGGQGQDEDHFDYLLAKYPPKDDSDDVLAAYGDSGSDGDYDDETWDEIQRDIEDSKREKDAVGMSVTDVEATIDKAIADLKASWQVNRFPKVQMKGYHLWIMAIKNGQRSIEIDRSRYWITRHDQAINRIRQAICKDVWHRASEVKHQCQSFEESLHSRDEYQHYLEVLSDDQPPTRPSIDVLQRRLRVDRTDLPEGEEILDSDSEFSLGDFVVEESSDVETIEHDAIPRDAETHKPEAADDDSWYYRGTDTSRMEALPERGSIDDTLAPGQDVVAVDASDEESDEEVISPARRWRRRQGNPLRTINEALKVAIPSADQTSGVQEDAEISDVDPLAIDPAVVDEPARSSHLDAEPPLPGTKYTHKGETEQQPIDLTMSSDLASPPENFDHGQSPDSGIYTPDLNPPKEGNITPCRLKLKVGSAPSSLQITTTPLFKLSKPSERKIRWPDLDDIPGIRGLPWEVLEGDRQDRKRLLAKILYSMHVNAARRTQKYVLKISSDFERFRASIFDGLRCLQKRQKEVPGLPERQWGVVRRLGLLFASFSNCKNLMDEDRVPKIALQDAVDKVEKTTFRPFCRTLEDALLFFCGPSETPGVRGTKRKLAQANSKSERDGDTDLLVPASGSLTPATPEAEIEPTTAQAHVSSIKKRKRAVQESKEALSQQQADQIRVQRQEERKAALQERQSQMQTGSQHPYAHAITFDEPIVYLDPHIGSRVKTHQVGGIQFMWRELVADPKQQGCLLAHTMGLGKTMQVISLLVTIARTAASHDLAFRDQVPEAMRQTRALILCPPSLIDNWRDEILMWSPTEHLLGHLRTVTTNLNLERRLREIREWSRFGGVLVIGYEMFRSLIVNKTAKGQNKLDESQHAQAQDDLLNSASIIVADEAHKMKNTDSSLAQVAKRLKSTSRVALTGSPLANNLEEYYAMIDWIAPGYLGDLVQFKQKYSEPIAYGLYAESSAADRRLCLRKLHVLKRDLDPKVNRADISAIEGDMPQKTEFYITIPLTPLQTKAYKSYVDYLLRADASSKTSNTRLWSWLATLSLLCNHPSCFHSKLSDRIYDTDEKNQKRKTPKINPTTDDLEGDALPPDVELRDVGLSRDAIEDLTEPFAVLEETQTLDDVKHSHRAKIVQQIVEASIHVGDKVLVFSHSIPTLNYLESVFHSLGWASRRLDGQTQMSKRQQETKDFNTGTDHCLVYLISMRAGGLGLNLQGANRVIIYDFGFNPVWEEQAVGRAYRLGQKKPVYVYRFRTGGTFEDVMYNMAVFKTQLAARVVDKKNPMRHASKAARDYLFHPREVKQHDLDEFRGKDPNVLDLVLQAKNPVRNIVLTETFQKEDDERLTAEELKAAEEDFKDQQLERNDPVAFRAKKVKEQLEVLARSRRGKTSSGAMGPQSSSAAVPTPSMAIPPAKVDPIRSITHQHAALDAALHIPSPVEYLSHLGEQCGPEHSSAPLNDWLPSAIYRPSQAINRHTRMYTHEDEPQNGMPYTLPMRASSEDPQANLGISHIIKDGSTSTMIANVDGADERSEEVQENVDSDDGCKTQ